jgi:release factor glutamine methyltransferase
MGTAEDIDMSDDTPGTGNTAAALMSDAAVRLRAADVPDPRRDARLLLAAAAQISTEKIFARPESAVAPEAVVKFQEYVARRTAREPVSRILGRREFWSLDFALSPATLDPRPDSECLIEAAIEFAGDLHSQGNRRGLRLLDLGTGSGCLLLAALASLPKASGVGVDISRRALDTASANAAALGLASRAQFLCSNWTKGVTGQFDIVLTNPPYIARADIDGLAPEVSDYEPKAALDGGEDGLDAYRRLAPMIFSCLEPGGIALIEVGEGQADAVKSLLKSAEFGHIASKSDLSGIERCIIATGPQR